MGLLYDFVQLARDSALIGRVCTPGNLSNNTVTADDSTLLRDLNSSLANLRCGYSSSNSSLGRALDMPCEDQTYNSFGNRIEITGPSADAIAAFLSIDSTDPKPFVYYPIQQTTCVNPLTMPACANIRLQTSGCQNDSNAVSMMTWTGDTYYWKGGAWEKMN